MSEHTEIKKMIKSQTISDHQSRRVQGNIADVKLTL